jgi:predicted nucleotidyltransferase
MGYLALDRYRNIEADLSAFCERWKVAELALLDLPEAERTDPDAELDLLVTIRPDAEWSLFDRVHMQDELSEIFCRRAHFYSWTGLVEFGNQPRTQLFRNAAHPLYVAV